MVEVNKIVSEVFLEDCMVGMKRYEDGYFDLAIVDVPYGIGEGMGQEVSRNQSKRTGSKSFVANSGKPLAVKYKISNWDNNSPDTEYFMELFRVSNNQIIFGANHFISKIPFDSSCWVVWDKDNSGDFADCELAWTSFDTAVRKIKYRWNGMLQHDMKNKEERIHPTQKPIGLYKRILELYANEGDKILDTHLGSGSSRIAAYDMGFDFTGFEIDADYYAAQEKRFQLYKSQGKLF